jgi:hypothetical protein
MKRMSDYQYKKAWKTEIDCAADCDVFHFFKFCEDHNVEHRILAASGPGGGNPCIELSGDKGEVLLALIDWHGPENIDIQELISSMYQ